MVMGMVSGSGFSDVLSSLPLALCMYLGRPSPQPLRSGSSSSKSRSIISIQTPRSRLPTPRVWAELTAGFITTMHDPWVRVTIYVGVEEITVAMVGFG